MLLKYEHATYKGKYEHAYKMQPKQMPTTSREVALAKMRREFGQGMHTLGKMKKHWKKVCRNVSGLEMWIRMVTYKVFARAWHNKQQILESLKRAREAQFYDENYEPVD